MMSMQCRCPAPVAARVSGLCRHITEVASDLCMREQLPVLLAHNKVLRTTALHNGSLLVLADTVHAPDRTAKSLLYS
jgi:hypothetical protein